MLRTQPPDAIIFEYFADMLAEHGASAPMVFSPLTAAGYNLFRFNMRGRLVHLDWSSANLPSTVRQRTKRDSSPKPSALMVGIAHRDTLFNVVALQPSALGDVALKL